MPPVGYEELARYLEEAQPREPEDSHQRKRLLIVEAATELFIKQGYRKTSMSEVAERAGVAKGTLYLYAKTKADLMVQAITLEKQRYLGALRPILEDDCAPRERLKRWLRVAVLLNTSMPLISRLISGDREIVAVLKEVNVQVQNRALEIQQQFVTEMLDFAARPHRWSSSELRDRARVLMGLLYSSGSFGEEWVRGWLSPERFAELLADMIVDGIAPPAGGKPTPH
jgi:AcrR family transcriptional regulator